MGRAMEAGDGLECVTETEEEAFQVMMPTGWQNRATLHRTEWSWRVLAHALSPNGDVLFLGDASLPNFVEPNPYLNEFLPVTPSHTSLQIRRFVRAESFFVEYVRQRYCQFPGFRAAESAPCPAYDRMVREMCGERSLNLLVTASRVTFEFKEGDETIRGGINGATYTNGMLWMADVSGVLTTGDPARYDDLLLHMVASVQINPAWQEREKARGAISSAAPIRCW